MRKVTTIVLSLIVSFTPVVPIAHADDQQVTVASDLSYPSPEYVSFVNSFTTALLDGLEKNAVQNPAPNHWIVFLLPVVSSSGKAMVEIKMIRNAEEPERPVLIGVLNEHSDPAMIHTAAKSVHYVIMRTVPQPSPPAQKLKTNNPRTKQRAGVSISMLS